MGLFLIAFLFVAVMFFSATLFVAACLFTGGVGVFESIWTTYTEMPGPVGTFIRVTWPMLIAAPVVIPIIRAIDDAVKEAAAAPAKERLKKREEEDRAFRESNKEEIARLQREEVTPILNWLYEHDPNEWNDTEEIREMRWKLKEAHSKIVRLSYVDRLCIADLNPE